MSGAGFGADISFGYEVADGLDLVFASSVDEREDLVGCHSLGGFDGFGYEFHEPGRFPLFRVGWRFETYFDSAVHGYGYDRGDVSFAADGMFGDEPNPVLL